MMFRDLKKAEKCFNDFLKCFELFFDNDLCKFGENSIYSIGIKKNIDNFPVFLFDKNYFDLQDDDLKEIIYHKQKIVLPYKSFFMSLNDCCSLFFKWTENLYCHLSMRKADKDHYLFDIGHIIYEEGERIDCVIHHLVTFQDFGNRFELQDPIDFMSIASKDEKGFLKYLNIFTGHSWRLLLLIQCIEEHDNYIVTDDIELQKSKNGKILRAHQRPKCIIINIDKIKRINRESLGGTHVSPIPHRRREHWRRI